MHYYECLGPIIAIAYWSRERLHTTNEYPESAPKRLHNGRDKWSRESIGRTESRIDLLELKMCIECNYAFRINTTNWTGIYYYLSIICGNLLANCVLVGQREWHRVVRIASVSRARRTRHQNRAAQFGLWWKRKSPIVHRKEKKKKMYAVHQSGIITAIRNESQFVLIINDHYSSDCMDCSARSSRINNKKRERERERGREEKLSFSMRNAQ